MDTLDSDKVIDAWAHVPPRHRPYKNDHEHVERALMILIGKMGSDWAKECALALHVNCEPDLKGYRLRLLEKMAKEVARQIAPWMDDDNRRLSEWIRAQIARDSSLTETWLTNTIYDRRMMGATWWNIRQFIRRVRQVIVIENNPQGYDVTEMLMKADDGQEIEIRNSSALGREVSDIWYDQRVEQFEDQSDADYEEYGLEVHEYTVQKIKVKLQREIDRSYRPAWIDQIVERHRRARKDKPPAQDDP